jgi:EAL and modified HD-GYP domain-containing signal transduction protein
MSEVAVHESLLSRQPILNVQEDLVGYELTLQPAREDEGCSRAATLVCAAYAELGVRSALGQATAFLPVDLDFLHGDAIEALPPESVVLELSFDGQPDERTLERCRTLRDRRYSLALNNYSGLDERSAPLLVMLDIIRIDIRQHDEKTLRGLAGPLVRLPLQLLAHGVDSREVMERCKAIGFRLFQGYFFARPEIVSGRRLSASQAALIQLINLTSRDAETREIEDGIKREPALAVNLLSIVNSVGYGAARNISSLSHAITMLGRRQLQRWFQLLLMTPSGKAPDTSRSPLLQVAALRGRMMEMLVEHCHPKNRVLADQGFITGIMSMMPAALGMPMSEIFEQISLETEVMEALISHSGDLGRLLALLECFDAEDGPGCDLLLNELSGYGLDRNSLNSFLIEALRWINGSDD